MRLPQTCPRFQVDTKRIQITPRAESIPLGGDNYLIVPDGAVTTSGFYNVAPSRDTAGRPYAGMSITPEGTAAADFNEPVELRINYALCPWADNPGRFVVVKMNAIGRPNLGGAKSQSRKFMRVFIGGLTEFAIAI